MNRLGFLIFLVIALISCDNNDTRDYTDMEEDHIIVNKEDSLNVSIDTSRKYGDCIKCLQIDQKSIDRLDTCINGFDSLSGYENFIDSLVSRNYECREDILISLKIENLLGELMKEHAEKTSSFVFLDSIKYTLAYNYVKEVAFEILDSDSILNRYDFNWEVCILNESDVSGFVYPGGKIFVTSGLLKSLNDKAELAGILAHLIAHIDRRHSINRAVVAYGATYILDALVTQNGISNLVSSLPLSAYSRSHEYDADQISIAYLRSTDYNPLAIKNFWMTLEDTSAISPIKSTHPISPDRFGKMDSIFMNLGQSIGDYFTSDYQTFLKMLL